ncbi:MAG TPA: hypothetical protein VN946_10750 [Terriglobales bacterium]|jgi:hypothetical protein|nr:hypothetical protein [Terriglobales bacterium]
MQSKFSTSLATQQVETRVSGPRAVILSSILNGSRKPGKYSDREPVKPIEQFTPIERCIWCCAPIWPVVLVDTGEIFNVEVTDDEGGTFAELTKPHCCFASRRWADFVQSPMEDQEPDGDEQ